MEVREGRGGEGLRLEAPEAQLRGLASIVFTHT